MAVKSFIRGDFRTLVIDNDYPTNYKVYYNGKWNYIQDEKSFINRLNPDLGESYLNRFNLKVLDNNQWINLAILENYYNKNEKRNSIFYRTITKENFSFKDRAVNFTELDARLGLNNLQDLFISNEDKSINNQIEENINENLNKDQICYFVGYDVSYDELSSVKYNSNEIDNFLYNEIAFNDNNIELDKYNEKISIDKKLLNNTNSFTISENLVINEEGTTFTSFLSNDHYVKSVLINNFGNSADNGGIFRFYDQDGNLIESGELITNTISYAETENFIITCNGTSWNSDSGWYCSGAFRTDINKKCLADTNLYYGYDSGVVGGWVKCEFKTPVKISRIESNIFGSNLTVRASWNSDTATVNVQFEDEVVEDFIYTVKRFNSNYIDSHNISEVAHPINTIEYIETSNNCRYDILEKYNKYSISGKRILDSDCDLHFAMSFDNRNTYYVYKDENWSIIDKDKEIINSNGMTLEELESINNNLILAEFPSNTNFDLFVTIVNKNSKYGEAPLLKSLDSYFLEKGKFDTFLVEEVNVYDFIFGSWGGCYIRFYDENSNLIRNDNIIQNTASIGETEMVIVETNSTYSSDFYPVNAARTDDNDEPIYKNLYGYCSATGYTNAYLKINFKEKQEISKIRINTNIDGVGCPGCKLKIKNSYSEKEFSFKNLSYNEIVDIVDFYNYYYYDNGIVKTNLNQLTNLNNFLSIQFNENNPNNTEIRYALSNDSNQNFYKFNFILDDWELIQEAEIINSGNTSDELESLTRDQCLKLNLINKTLDIIAVLKTNDRKVTPRLSTVLVKSSYKL